MQQSISRVFPPVRSTKLWMANLARSFARSRKSGSKMPRCASSNFGSAPGRNSDNGRTKLSSSTMMSTVASPIAKRMKAPVLESQGNFASQPCTRKRTWQIVSGRSRRASPDRRALHRRLSLGVCDPQLHAGAGLVGVDRELAALEQRLHAAIAEFLRRRVAVKLCSELDDQRRLQRAVKNQARIAFDLGDVVAVIMDAVAVEGQRRVAKQQHGIADMAFA